MPHAARAGARKRRGLESAFCLSQVDEVLRHAFLAQHSRNHFAITPGAPQTGLHNCAAARGLKEVQEGQHLVVHGQRQIVRNVFGGFLGARFQAGIDREGHLRDFVNRRGYRGGLVETISGAEGLQLVGVDGVHHAVKEFAQLRVGIRIVTALQHPIDGLVEIPAGRFEVSGLIVLFAGSEFFFDSLDQVLPGIGDRR